MSNQRESRRKIWDLGMGRDREGRERWGRRKKERAGRSSGKSYGNTIPVMITAIPPHPVTQR